MEAARATLADLQRSGALDTLLLARGARCAGWALVLTGHSLGAGAAFLMGLYLRRHFPDVT
jgi:sn1-specific diacylglycerol lipase